MSVQDVFENCRSVAYGCIVLATSSLSALAQEGGAPAPEAAPMPGALPSVPPMQAASHDIMASLPENLSPWSMFLNADIIVQVVMVGLALASLVTWTIWLAKGIELLAAKRRAISAKQKIECAESLEQARS